MNVKIKATTSFMHGRTQVHAGDEAEFTKGDAQELVKNGLATMADGTDTAPKDDADALLGDADGEKAAPEVDNKMADATANKSRTIRK